MNYKSWFCLSVVAVSAAILTGCSSSEGNKTPSASPSPAASPATNTAPAPTAAAPAPATPATTPAAGFGGQPVVADKTTTARAIETATGLIPPTNGDNWVKTVAKGRPDPFAVLAMQPVQKVDPNATTEEQIEKLRNSLNAKKSGGENKTTTPSSSPLDTPAAAKPSKTKIASAPITPIKPVVIPVAKIDKTTKSTKKVAKANSNDKITVSKEPVAGQSSIDKPTAKTPAKTPTKTTNDKTVALKPVPTPLTPATGTITTAAPAPKPEPTLARGIEVSGVIQAGGNTQVVVKLPKESFSRYVEVGDRVMDGKVLVKRIENSSSLVPVVVLEEVGIEVARKVGDTSTPAAQKETK